MSLIKEQLWKDCFGEGDDVPKMPPGCTYWQFAAAREAMWTDDDLDASKRYIKQLEHLKTLPNLAAHQDELDELITNELERIKDL